MPKFRLNLILDDEIGEKLNFISAKHMRSKTNMIGYLIIKEYERLKNEDI
jgi:hypothetical protein